MSKIHILIISFLALGLAVTACGPKTRTVKVDDRQVEIEAKIQREIGFISNQKKNLHLQDIAYPLLAGGVPFCGENIRPVLGMIFANTFSFEAPYRDIAARYYGMDEKLKIIDIYDTSPAEEAGLKVNDIIKKVNRQPVITGEHGVEKLAAQLREGLKATARPVEIMVERDGQEMIFQLMAEEVCNYPVLLVNSDDINAFADGQVVGITQGMMRFVEQDQELSLVIAHELAHNTMGHISSQRSNMLLGNILDIAVGIVTGISTQGIFGHFANRVYSQEFEMEADYVGLYIMANAGLETEGAAHFWRRMAIANPSGVQKGFMSSHPSSPERFLAIEEAAKEIQRKLRLELPLQPEMK